MRETLKYCVELLVLSVLSAERRRLTLAQLAERVSCEDSIATYEELMEVYDRLHRA